MGSCTDFANEKSQLEYVCQSLGVKAIPQISIGMQKGKATFDSLIAKCISRDLLTTDRIRKFSRRAHSYMLTYSSLQFIHEDKGQQQVMTNNTFTHTKIENMKKILKSHSAALDFDQGFIITSVLTSSDFNWKEELESGDIKNRHNCYELAGSIFTIDWANPTNILFHFGI
jgi:hypothetical protein